MVQFGGQIPLDQELNPFCAKPGKGEMRSEGPVLNQDLGLSNDKGQESRAIWITFTLATAD